MNDLTNLGPEALADLGERVNVLLNSGCTTAVAAFALQTDEATAERALTVYRRRTDPDVVTRAWAEELHPTWCVSDPGCGSSHFSEPTATAATADTKPSDLTDGSGVPFASAAAVMFTDGRRGVSLVVDNAKHGRSTYQVADVTFTVAEAREHAALVLRLADLAESDTPMAARPVNPATATGGAR